MRMGDLSNERLDGRGGGLAAGASQEGGRAHADESSCAQSPSVAAEGCLSEADVKMARLVRTIEGEIVPRLVLARRVTRLREGSQGAARQAPDSSDVKELVRLLLAHDVGVSSAYVETVRQRGATLELVCLELLAPAARELGLLWEEDECDFMQVTVGLCRLHQLLRELSPEFRCDDTERTLDRRILLAPCPGEQHTFGISVVAQFLRRAGWDVWDEYPTGQAEILELVRNNWFAVVGLSLGSDARVEHTAQIIRSIRQASRNAQVGILVGGPILLKRPELAVLVGADATAADGPQAVLRAEHICSVQARCAL